MVMDKLCYDNEILVISFKSWLLILCILVCNFDTALITLWFILIENEKSDDHFILDKINSNTNKLFVFSLTNR